jgi:hypothetical protein
VTRAGGPAAGGDGVVVAAPDRIAAALARAPALTVRALRVRAVELPLDRPTETAAGAIPSTPLALLDLGTEQGVTGHAYVACYSRAGLAGVVAALEALELAGRPLESLSDDLRR